VRLFFFKFFLFLEVKPSAAGQQRAPPTPCHLAAVAGSCHLPGRLDAAVEIMPQRAPIGTALPLCAFWPPHVS
jgi:hypothetical protein